MDPNVRMWENFIGSDKGNLRSVRRISDSRISRRHGHCSVLGRVAMRILGVLQSLGIQDLVCDLFVPHARLSSSLHFYYRPS